MSFRVYKREQFIFVEYEPQNGTEFLFKIFELEFPPALSLGVKEELIERAKEFKLKKFDKIASSLQDSLAANGYVKNGIRLLRETLAPEIFESKYNAKKRLLFLLGVLDGDFYRIPRYLLTSYRGNDHISVDVLIHKNVKISNKLFFHDSSHLYFGIIDLIQHDTPIVIGGGEENSIPEDDFKKLVEKLPTRTGYSHYMKAQIEKLFSGYFEIRGDYVLKYKEYLNKKKQKVGFRFIEEISEYERNKYLFIRDKLTEMLRMVGDYSESEWQSEILEIVLILFPKYTEVLSELTIKTPAGEGRRLDFAILDAEGHLDIIEIKQPFDDCLVTKNPSRNNFVPVKELSTTIVQAEKYIFYLNKWGSEGERILLKKFKEKLKRDDLKLKVTNPKAILILGRDYNLSSDQKRDFEVIKRQYSNILDIITYDDLLRRLSSLIKRFQ